MAFEPSRVAGNGVRQGGRQGRIQHRFPALPPGSIERLKPWRTERVRSLIEPFVRTLWWASARAKVPAQILHKVRTKRRTELLMKRGRIAPDRVRLSPR